MHDSVPDQVLCLVGQIILLVLNLAHRQRHQRRLEVENGWLAIIAEKEKFDATGSSLNVDVAPGLDTTVNTISRPGKISYRWICRSY